MAQTLKALKSNYELLFDSCLISPNRSKLVNAAASKIRANRVRYESAGSTLGVPWYVVGLIHMMESGGNFKSHLHNGDPLTARTTRVPTGRPKTGTPPFTWEESAADALGLQGFGKWTDWNTAGILYKLEEYNGWGYRDHHPDVNTPYLWSFSNHYTSGKYVSDGTFDKTAVSAQCGAAVVLKRLVQLGVLGPDETEPRTLTLTSPYMTGDDVESAQRLLRKNPYEDYQPGEPDREYGPVTADAARRAKWALGYAEEDVNRTFGPILRGLLDGSAKLAKANERLRAKRLKDGAAEGPVRKKIVEWALWGVKNTNQIAYSQGASRMAALQTPGALPLATDCSAFSTLCYSWAGAPNPNYDGPYAIAQGGYTGTMLNRCQHISAGAVKPGDLVVWTPPTVGQHVCIVVTTGADPMLVSHGSDRGPLKIRFSDEDAYQRSHGHGTVVWLSVF